MSHDTQLTNPAPTGRHPLNVGHLVAGLVLLGLVAMWAVIQLGPATLDDVRWMLPLPWVLGGGIGLVAATVASRRQAQAEAVRPGDHTPYCTPTATSTEENR